MATPDELREKLRKMREAEAVPPAVEPSKPTADELRAKLKALRAEAPTPTPDARSRRDYASAHPEEALAAVEIARAQKERDYIEEGKTPETARALSYRDADLFMMNRPSRAAEANIRASEEMPSLGGTATRVLAPGVRAVEPHPTPKQEREEQYRGEVRKIDASLGNLQGAIDAFHTAWEGSTPPMSEGDYKAAVGDKDWLQKAKEAGYGALDLDLGVLTGGLLGRVTGGRIGNYPTPDRLRAEASLISDAIDNLSADPDLPKVVSLEGYGEIAKRAIVKTYAPDAAAFWGEHLGLLKPREANALRQDAIDARPAEHFDLLAPKLHEAATSDDPEAWTAGLDALLSLPPSVIPDKDVLNSPDVGRFRSAIEATPGAFDGDEWAGVRQRVEQKATDAEVALALRQVPLGSLIGVQPDLMPDMSAIARLVERRDAARQKWGGATTEALERLVTAAAVTPATKEGLPVYVESMPAQVMRLAGTAFEMLAEADVPMYDVNPTLWGIAAIGDAAGAKDFTAHVRNSRLPTKRGLDVMLSSGAYDDMLTMAGLGPYRPLLGNDSSSWGARVLADVIYPEFQGLGLSATAERAGMDPTSTLATTLDVIDLGAGFLPAEEIVAAPVGIVARAGLRARAGARAMPKGYKLRGALAKAAPSAWSAFSGEKLLDIDGDTALHHAMLSAVESELKAGRDIQVPPAFWDSVKKAAESIGANPDELVGEVKKTLAYRRARTIETMADMLARQATPEMEALRKTPEYVRVANEMDALVKAGTLTPDQAHGNLMLDEVRAFILTDAGEFATPEDYFASVQREVGGTSGAGAYFQVKPDASPDEVIAELNKVGIIPQRRMLAILGSGRPEYLDPVIEFIVQQRQKLRDGALSRRDVAKAYLLTLSSIQQSEIPLTTLAAKGDVSFIKEGRDTVRYLDREGNPGPVAVRPEDYAAAWMLSPTGKRVLDNLEAGTITPKDEAAVAAVRRIYSSNTFENAFKTPGKGEFTLRNLAEATDAINATGGDPAAVEATVKRFKGIQNMKAPFIAQLLGIGDMPTLDAVDMNGLLTGKGRIPNAVGDIKGEAKRRLLLAKKVKDSGSGSRAEAWMIDQWRSALDRLRAKGVPGTDDIAPEAFGAVMHHWFWDKLKGGETTHEGLYEAQRYASTIGGKQTEQGTIERVVRGPAQVEPWQMTRAEFEATGEPLLHGTSAKFDEFQATAKNRYGGENRLGAHYFTDDPAVAQRFSLNKGVEEYTADGLLSRTEGAGSGDDVLDDLGDRVRDLQRKGLDAIRRGQDAEASSLYQQASEELRTGIKAMAERKIAAGQRMFYLDDAGQLTPAASVNDIPDNVWDDGVVYFARKGREPRVVSAKVYGKVLDLTSPKSVPPDLLATLTAAGEDVRWLRDEHQLPNWDHEFSPGLVKWARENGYGKMRVRDAWESGFKSTIALPEYVGYGRDPHKAMVRAAMDRGERVPPDVLSDYPALMSDALREGRVALEDFAPPGTRVNYQKIGPTIRGSIEPKTVGYLQRFFQTADFNTLLHEDGHLLRFLFGDRWTSELAKHFEHTVDPQGFTTLTRTGEEQAAEAIRRYMRSRIQPNGRLRAKLEDTYFALQDLYLRMRGQTPNLPVELRAMWDATLRPDDAVRPASILLADHEIPQPRPVTVVPPRTGPGDIAAVGENRMAKAGRRAEAEKVLIDRARVRQAIGLPESVQEVPADELLAKLFAYVGVEKARQGIQGEDWVKLTNRSMVPKGRLERIQRAVKGDLRLVLGTDDWLPLIDEANKTIRLDAPQAAAMRGLITDLANEPYGATLPVSVLDFDGNAGTMAIEDWNTVQSHLADRHAGVGSSMDQRVWAARGPLLGAFLRSMKGVVIDADTTKHAEKLAQDAERKFRVDVSATQYMAPGVHDAYEGFIRSLGEAGRTVVRWVEAAVEAPGGAAKSFGEIAKDVLPHLAPQVHPDAAPKLLELSRRFRGEGELARSGGVSGLNIDDVTDDANLTEIASVFQTANRVTDDERVALLALHRTRGEMAAIGDDPLARADYFIANGHIIADAVSIVETGLRRRAGVVEKQAKEIWLSLAGSTDEAVWVRLGVDENATKPEDNAYVRAYQLFHDGDWNRLFRLADERAQLIVGGHEYNQGQAIISMLTRLYTEQLWTDFTHALYDMGVDLDVDKSAVKGVAESARLPKSYELGSRRGGRDAFAQRVLDNIQAEVGWKNREKIIEAPMPGQPRSFEPAEGATGPKGVEDLEAYSKAHQILHQLGWKYGKGAFDAHPVLMPDGSEVYLPQMMANEVAGVIDRVAKVGVAFADTTSSGAGIFGAGERRLARVVPPDAKAAAEIRMRQGARLGGAVAGGILGALAAGPIGAAAGAAFGSRLAPTMAETAGSFARTAAREAAEVGGEALARPAAVAAGAVGAVAGAAKGSVGAAIGTLLSTFHTTTSLARVGMTTGLLIPNLSSFIGNLWGAFFQTYQVRGLSGALRAWGTNPRMLGDVVGRLWGDGPMRYRLGSKPIITPDGRILTAEMIAHDFVAHGLDSSFPKSESAEAIATDIARRIGTWPQRFLEDPADALGAPPRWLQHQLTEAWTSIDNMNRVAVYLDALHEGRSVAEAAELARLAAFDYGNLTEFERHVMRNTVLFYSFMRQNIRLFWHSMIHDPHRVLGQLRLAGGLQREFVEDEPYLTFPEYAQGRLVLGLRQAAVDAFGSQQGVATLSPPMPAMDVINLTTDLLGMALGSQDAAQEVAARTVPWVQGGIVAAFNIDPWSGRDLSGQSAVPSFLVEGDRMATGGIVVDAALDVRRVYDETKGQYVYKAGNDKMWWFYRNVLQLPPAGRSMSTLEQIDRAAPFDAQPVSDVVGMLRTYREAGGNETLDAFFSGPANAAVTWAVGGDPLAPYVFEAPSNVDDLAAPRPGVNVDEERRKLLGFPTATIPTVEANADTIHAAIRRAAQKAGNKARSGEDFK